MLIWKALKLDYVVEVGSHQISDKVAEKTRKWQNTQYCIAVESLLTRYVSNSWTWIIKKDNSTLQHIVFII